MREEAAIISAEALIFVPCLQRCLPIDMRLRLFNALKATSIRQSRVWVCHECRARTTIRWQHSASLPSLTEKPYYVTSPIFYVNAGKKSLLDTLPIRLITV